MLRPRPPEMPARTSTGGKHRDRVLTFLASGAYETADIAVALGVPRYAVLPALRALEREGLVAEAYRVRRRTANGAGRRAIVWRLAT